MNERQIEEKVKSAFTSDIPDNFDIILEKSIAQKEKIVKMPKAKILSPKYMRIIISTAAAVVIVVTAGFVGTKFSHDGQDIGNSLEGFFETTVTQNSSEQGTTSNNSSVGSHQGTTSNTQSNNNSQAGPTTSTGTSTGNDDYKAEPVVPGMSWAQVLAKMPKKLKGTSITVFNWNFAKEYTGAPKVIEKFTAQTGIRVVWQTIPYNTYFNKLSAVINSGKNIPDVVRARGPIPQDMLYYQPLATAKFDFSGEAWDQDIMDLYTVNGIHYAVNLKNTNIGSVDLMFYNKALIDKYNMEDPYKLWKSGNWNWEKYLEMCRDYKNETGNLASCGEGWYRSYPSVFGIDGAIAFDGRKFYNNMNNKDFLSVHQTLGDLYNKEKLFAFGQESFFNEGNRLFSIGTSVEMRRENSYFANLKNEGLLCAVPVPSPKDAKKYTQGLGEAEAYAIANGAPNPEAVPYFLRYFLDGKNYELSTYFCNKQNLEVYNWCMNQRNKTFVYAYPNSATADVEDGFKDKIGEDMKNFINANKGNVDKFVKEYNTTIKKVNK